MSYNSDDSAVGRVIGLWRYPVKSMGAEALDKVDVSWHGFDGDRRWAFIRHGVTRSGFPWFTLRQRNDMNRYVPDFESSTVRTPSGAVFAVDDPVLAAELAPGGARVIKQDRGVFDTFPLSLITKQTISKLGEFVGRDLDILRFRPNILVDAADDEPFLEDTWVGMVLRIGDLSMRVDQRDGRCVVITIDPESSERSPDILKTVVQQRQGCLGVYGTTVVPGTVAVDDEVRLYTN